MQKSVLGQETREKMNWSDIAQPFDFNNEVEDIIGFVLMLFGLYVFWRLMGELKARDE